MKKTHGQMSESFALSALLTIVGGFLDAYTYICRGGVFANAQTGNIVLLGLSVAERRWSTAVRYLLPILSFAVGVILAEMIRERYRRMPQSEVGMHWRQIVILAEIVLLAMVAFLPQRMNTLVDAVISCVCALQVHSFRKVRGSAFATTMCTGNLRSGTEQLMIWLRSRDAKAGRRAGIYGAILLLFSIGAVLGGISAAKLGEKSILLCCILLLVVYAIMFAEEEQGGKRRYRM